ncbi:hypothetical protein BD309DRAFT_1003938 [Dichomitus squalens]|nr:hypothetical protein BD309DRAFT_1003938 [Dichomitus squalens]
MNMKAGGLGLMSDCTSRSKRYGSTTNAEVKCRSTAREQGHLRVCWPHSERIGVHFVMKMCSAHDPARTVIDVQPNSEVFVERPEGTAGRSKLFLLEDGVNVSRLGALAKADEYTSVRRYVDDCLQIVTSFSSQSGSPSDAAAYLGWVAAASTGKGTQLVYIVVGCCCGTVGAAVMHAGLACPLAELQAEMRVPSRLDLKDEVGALGAVRPALRGDVDATPKELPQGGCIERCCYKLVVFVSGAILKTEMRRRGRCATGRAFAARCLEGYKCNEGQTKRKERENGIGDAVAKKGELVVVDSGEDRKHSGDSRPDKSQTQTGTTPFPGSRNAHTGPSFISGKKDFCDDNCARWYYILWHNQGGGELLWKTLFATPVKNEKGLDSDL